MSTLQQIKNLHSSQQVANSDENETLDPLVSFTERGCHIIFTWCPSHSAARGNELADVAPKGGTTWNRKEWVIIMTQRKRQHGTRLRNPLLPTSVYVPSTAKEEKKWTTSWIACSCQGRTKSPSADWGAAITRTWNTGSTRSAERSILYGEGDSWACNRGVPSDPPPYSPTTRTLPYRDHPPQGLGVVRAVEDRAWPSRHFTARAAHLDHRFSCFVNKNYSLQWRSTLGNVPHTNTP